MRSFAIAATMVASASMAVAGSASATVQNNCDHDIYVWNVVDYTTPPTETVSPGQSWTKPLTEAGNGGGHSIKVSPNDDVATNITQFEYTYTPGSSFGSIWYDISNIDGTPFENVLTQLVPSHNLGVGSCGVVNCPKNQKECADAYKYPTDDLATHTCPDGTDLTFNVCEPKGSGNSGNSNSGSGSSSAPAASSPAASSTAASSPAASSPAPHVQSPAPQAPSPTPTPAPSPVASADPAATTVIVHAEEVHTVIASATPVAAPVSGSAFALQFDASGKASEGKIAKREAHANHMERHQRIRRMHHARTVE